MRHTQALGAAGRSHRAGPCRVHRFCAQRRTSGYLTQPCNRSHLCTFGAMLLPLHTICEEMPCHARDGQQGVVHPRLLRPRTGPENCPENWVARELGFHGVSDLAMVGTAQCQIPLPPFTFRQPRQTYDWLSTDPSTPPSPRTGPVRPRVWAGPFSILQLRACVAPRAPYPTRGPTRGPTLSPAPAPAHRSLKVAARMRPSWRHWVLAPVGYCALESRVGTMRCTLILERSMSSPTFGPITFFQ